VKVGELRIEKEDLHIRNQQSGFLQMGLHGVRVVWSDSCEPVFSLLIERISGHVGVHISPVLSPAARSLCNEQPEISQ
jgi:hypothetical protein